MLEMIRAYAAERLAVSPHRDSVRERHFRYFQSVAAHHGPARAIDGPNGGEHLAALDSEIENVRSALQWAVERDATGQALEMSEALIDYWMRRNRFAEAVDWVEPALQRSDATADPAVRARALCTVCWPLWAVGRTEEAPALLSEAETIARALSDPLTLAFVLYHRAALMSYRGEQDVAAAAADEALACAMASGDSWTIAMAAWARAKAARSADELRDRVDEAASLLEQVGNTYHSAALFHDSVGQAFGRGWDDDATAYLQRAAPLISALDRPYEWMLLCGNVGLVAILAGDAEAARDAFREELKLSRELVVPPAASGALTGLAAVAAVEDEPERAARLAGAAATHRHGERQDAVDARLDATFLDPARTRLGTDAWDAALRQGAALSFNDAIADGLDEQRQHAGHPDSNSPSRPAQGR